MTRLFRSKSCGLVGLTEFNPGPSPFFHQSNQNYGGEEEEEEEEEEEDLESEEDVINGYCIPGNPISTPFISPAARLGGGMSEGKNGNSTSGQQNSNNNQFQILDILVTALRKSIVTCSVERDEASSMDISWPTEVRHVSHVTFDRFNGFLGLPTELEPEVPRKAPSASVRVFGVSAKSMQCSYDDRGNSVPTILLMMQKRLYAEGGLKAEGIFRITAENSQEQYVRDQLNKGVVPRGIDVHCLAGLIKAWLRELPTGVLDSLKPEQVMHCNTEEDCTKLMKSLPPMEAALLDWAINLMADVVQHEHYNKMNARNIAMVFAPNMTQMADPLTALIHAVQVMNFLKTLILKTKREREESVAKTRLFPLNSDSPENKNDLGPSFDQTLSYHTPEGPSTAKLLKAATLSRLESDAEEKLWSFKRKSDDKEEFDSVSGNITTPVLRRRDDSKNGLRGEYNDDGDWLSLRKGVRRLCRHPVFQLGKTSSKKTEVLGL